MTGARGNHYADATLADFGRDLWDGRVWIAAGLAVGLVLAVIFLTLAVPRYKAQMLVGPVAAPAADENENGQTAPLDFARFESILRAPSVAAAVKRDPALVAGIAADRRWRGGDAPETDSAAQVADYLEKNIRVEPAGATILRRVTYTHPDAAFAARLLAAVHKAADTMIREEGRTRAGERAVQLQATLAQTQNAAHRRALTDLLMGQEQARMVLAIDQPFAAAIAEAPAAGAKPDWPRKAVVLPVMMLAGAFFGFALFSMRRRPA
jgi:uncharacterized protein involved in exopolysaccharide biosynthesis